jgi:hypothetical protein
MVKEDKEGVMEALLKINQDKHPLLHFYLSLRAYQMNE